LVHNEKFKIEQVMKGNMRTIMLRGSIDEDTSFAPLLKVAGPVVFNFRGVTAINSCGVRSWVNFLKDISDRQVIYEECPPLIVRQMNMVPSFVGHAKVISVFGAYVCDNCDEEKLVLIKDAQYAKGKVSIEDAMPCQECNEGEMEFDGHPQQYFAFAK